MANYNDYQLEDAENAAVNKSKNLKRGLAVGAGVVGVGGAAAFAATQLGGNGDSDSDLTAEDLVAGAEAGADGAEDAVEKEAPVQEHHTAKAAPAPEPEPEVDVDQTTIIYDEDGNYIASADEGKIDGKDFMVLDTDGNGKGDIIAYDENGNGIYEDHEIAYMDNETYQMGQGQNVAVYQEDEWGDLVKVADGPNIGPHPVAGIHHNNTNDFDDDISDIGNDFVDEKTGETYHGDLAENNPDYNNHDNAEQYSASLDGVENDYGYNEPSNDFTAYDESASHDDASFYDA